MTPRKGVVGARFFLFINLFKLPFMADLRIINRTSLTLDLVLLPGSLLGIALGRWLISRVPQRIFELLLYCFTLAARLRMLCF